MCGKTAAIYARVDHGGSKESRAEALNGQVNALKEFAKGNGIDGIYIYKDNGFSGADMARPGLAQMMRDYEAGRFSSVLVYNRSRLYRGPVGTEPKWKFPVVSLCGLENCGGANEYAAC